jgi:hypothetical protein
MGINVGVEVKENNARFLGLIFYGLLTVIFFSILIFFDSSYLKNKSIDGSFILFNTIVLLIVSLSLNVIIVPMLNSLIKKFKVDDDYVNQIRIHQELENIKLAKELREKGKKPIIQNLYSDSVKLHLGISLQKKISPWKKLLEKIRKLFRKKKKKKKSNKKS